MYKNLVIKDETFFDSWGYHVNGTAFEIVVQDNGTFTLKLEYPNREENNAFFIDGFESIEIALKYINEI